MRVLVILQPFKDELPEDFKCKDKFLVQTAPVSAAFEQNDITSMVRFYIVLRFYCFENVC